MKKEFQYISETVGNVTYYGEAVPGYLTSQPYWGVRKVTNTLGLVETVFPVISGNKGTQENIFVWDNRASITYSNL